MKWVAISFFGDLPDPGISPLSLLSPALAGGFFTTVPHGKRLGYASFLLIIFSRHFHLYNHDSFFPRWWGVYQSYSFFFFFSSLILLLGCFASVEFWSLYTRVLMRSAPWPIVRVQDVADPAAGLFRAQCRLL